MAYCQNCGRLMSGNVCQNCSAEAPQIPVQNIQQYPGTNYSAIAVVLLMFGAIILSCGVFALAFVPDEIEVGDVDPGSDKITFGVEMSGYKIGVLLLGIGVLIEGMGSALATKEHFSRLDNIGGKRY